MSLQYISDSTGKTTGVFIPIEEWNVIKAKYKGIENNEFDIPQWQKNVVNERYESYIKNPNSAMDFNKAMDDIEKDI